MLITRDERLEGEKSSEYAYRVLKENIMNLNLKPGEAIGEVDLALKFKISRTPLREAITKLRKEYLVDVHQGHGTFVSKLDASLIEEARFMRSTLECAVAKEACMQISPESIKELEQNLLHQKQIIELNFSAVEYFKLDNIFHQTIFASCHKSTIWQQICLISSHFNRIRLLDANKQTITKQALEQHQRILELIKSHAVAELEAEVESHITSFTNRYQELQKEFPDFFVAPIKTLYK